MFGKPKKQMLKSWIPKEKIDWISLSRNSSPHAMTLLAQNPEKIDWRNLSKNPSPHAILLLEILADKYFDKIYWGWLSRNPLAITLLEKREEYERTHFSTQELEEQQDTVMFLDWNFLSGNPSAIPLLEKEAQHNPNRICWSALSGNPAATPLLETNTKNINWKILYLNPSAMELLEKNGECYLYYLSRNPSAIPLLEKQVETQGHLFNWEHLSDKPYASNILKYALKNKIDKICWEGLCQNPNIVDILSDFDEEMYLHKINWAVLSANPSAISLLEKYPEKINWYVLSRNHNATELLFNKAKENPDALSWDWISKNPGATDFLPHFLDRIDWNTLFENPAIFEDEPIGIK